MNKKQLFKLKSKKSAAQCVEDFSEKPHRHPRAIHSKAKLCCGSFHALIDSSTFSHFC